jgi:hypothetical protein
MLSTQFDFNLTFSTRDQAINSIKSFYIQHGFIIVIEKSRAGKVWLKCDLGKTYRNPLGLTDEIRKRQTSSRLTGCKFRISCVYRVRDDLWHLSPIELNHNHEPSLDLSGHSIARRLNQEEKKRVLSLAESGVGPSQILSYIKKDFNNQTTSRKEIHNFLASSRINMLNGKNPVEKLLEILYQKDFYFNYKTSEHGVITNIFFQIIDQSTYVNSMIKYL